MADQAMMEKHVMAVGRAFTWHELYVPNAETGRKFYQDALGWEPEDMPMGEMGTYRMMKAFGTGVCGAVSTTDLPNGGEIPPHWAVYIAVDDVDAKVARCESLGAKVVVPTMTVPTVGRMCLLQDPQGAHFWLFEGEM